MIAKTKDRSIAPMSIQAKTLVPKFLPSTRIVLLPYIKLRLTLVVCTVAYCHIKGDFLAVALDNDLDRIAYLM